MLPVRLVAYLWLGYVIMKFMVLNATHNIINIYICRSVKYVKSTRGSVT